MILFDWGTYNGYHKLSIAALLGMKLTEIPPYDFARKKPEDYFVKYKEYAKKAFTTITAHAPYYNIVSVSPEVQKTTEKALKEAVKKAVLAGAEIFNLHLGWRAYMDGRDIEVAGDVLKKLIKASDNKLVISVEVPYTRRMIGTWEEIKALKEIVGEEKLIVSVQLENVWMLETNVSETGDFEIANSQTTVSFWKNILEKTKSLSHNYLSLRFSQVIGFAIGKRILKKRVPLGKGYPDINPLAEALAEYMIKDIKYKDLPYKMHVIYTGPPETKYKDTITLYAEIMKRAVDHT